MVTNITFLHDPLFFWHIHEFLMFEFEIMF